MPDIQASRLRLRRLTEEDLDALAEIYTDPEMMRHIGDGAVRDRAQTAEHLERISRSWADRGFGLLGVEVRETGRLAGWAGLVPAHGRPVAVYALTRHEWSRD